MRSNLVKFEVPEPFAGMAKEQSSLCAKTHKAMEARRRK